MNGVKLSHIINGSCFKFIDVNGGVIGIKRAHVNDVHDMSCEDAEKMWELIHTEGKIQEGMRNFPMSVDGFIVPSYL